MKAKNISKRVLSVILCTVMLFSCWVFTAPTANAAPSSGGTYYVRIWWHVDDDSGKDNQIVIQYKGQNGETADQRVYKNGSDGNVASSNGNFSADYALTGVPYGIWIKISCAGGTGIGQSKWWVTKMTVSPNSNYTTGAITLFNGQWGGAKYGVLAGSASGTLTLPSSFADPNIGDKRHSNSDYDSRSGQAPAVKYIDSLSATNVEIPISDSTTSTVTKGTVRDQYGVKWSDQTTTTYIPTATTGFSVASDNQNITVSSTAMMSASPWYRDCTIGIKSGSTVLKDGATSSTNRTATIRATNPSYKVTWYWQKDNTSNTNNNYDSYCDNNYYYYNQTVNAPDAAKTKTSYYNTAKHYSGGSYASLKVSDTATTKYMTYSSNANHDYTYSEISGDNTNHKATCSCGYTKNVGHSYGSYSDHSATQHKRTCGTSGCGHVEYSNHAYPNTWTNHNATQHKKVCTASNCGHIIYEDHDWDDGEITTQPTCEGTGIKTYTCKASGCGATYTETVAAKGHDIAGVSWSSNDTQHWKVCKNDPSHLRETAAHTFDDWYEVDGSTHAHACSVCGKVVSAEHRYVGDWINAEDGDGSTSGGRHYKICADCGYVLYENHTKHTFTSVYTDPTCTADGYTTYTCGAAGCGYTYVVVDTGSATGHDAAKLDDDSVIAYESDGNNHWKTCDWCNQAVYNNNGTWTIGTDGHNPVTTKRDATTLVTPATCTTAGIYHHVCSVCAAVLSTQYQVSDGGEGKALGHSWARWKGCSEETVSELNGSVPVVFECQNGCGNYCAATYDEEAKKYNPTEIFGKYDDVKGYSDQIQTPTFNEHEEYFDGEMEPPYQYADRKASLRVRPSERGEDTQAMRFSGNISAYSIAKKVSFEVNPDKIYDNSKLMSLAEIRAKNKADKTAFEDDTVIDFGFVYTQAKYIRSAQKTINYDLLTLDYMGKNNPTTNQDCRIYRMSVVENNKGNGTLSNNWKGFTDCYNYPTEEAGEWGQYTFNLVINVNVKNYQATYCARTYVIYKYHGDIICVYDQPELGESPIHSHDSVYNQAIKNEATGKLPQTVVDYLDYKIINRTIKGEERYVQQSFIDWDWNYKLTNFKEIEQQNP